MKYMRSIYMKSVSIIIVNWNGKKDTLQCLHSLFAMIKNRIHTEIVVVDNASTDDSVLVVSKQFSTVHIIKNKKNLGFTGGNNVGIMYALAHGADAVWLLNNDTYVDKYAMRALIDALTNEYVGIVGSKIYFSYGREFHDRYAEKEKGRVLWYAGGAIDWKNMYASHRGVDEVDQGQYDKREETPFITGCSMMIKRAVFEAVGYLDDKFYLYLEDLDFSLRAKRAGFSLVYVPGSTIWHNNAGSTDTPGHGLHEYYITRNRLLVGMRYAPLRTKIALVREAVQFAFGGSHSQKQAVVDAVMGKFGNQYSWKHNH